MGETFKQIQKLARIDIYAIVSEHVNLEQSPGGKDYYGDCPFCTRPKALAIAPSKGLFYCFGCKKGGDPVTFLRLFQNKTIEEVIQELGERYEIL